MIRLTCVLLDVHVRCSGRLSGSTKFYRRQIMEWGVDAGHVRGHLVGVATGGLLPQAAQGRRQVTPPPSVHLACQLAFLGTCKSCTFVHKQLWGAVRSPLHPLSTLPVYLHFGVTYLSTHPAAAQGAVRLPLHPLFTLPVNLFFRVHATCTPFRPPWSPQQHSGSTFPGAVCQADGSKMDGMCFVLLRSK